MLHIPGSQRKQIIQPLSHKSRAQPMSEVRSREVTDQNKHYSLNQHLKFFIPLSHKIIQIQFLDSPQTVIHQPEVNHPENIELDFPECQIEKDIATNSSFSRGSY